MLRAFNAGLRVRSSRRLGRTVAFLMAAGTMVMVNPATVQAADAEAGSVEVDGLPLAINFTCSGQCPNDVTATSSGSISGVDGTSPFEVAWAAPPVGATNVAASISYSPTCLAGDVTEGATVNASTLVISGAQLTYGTSSIAVPATVTLYFSGLLAEGMFVPMTTEVRVVSATQTIDIAGPHFIPGSMPAVPTSTGVSCNGTQTFTASGTFLTAG